MRWMYRLLARIVVAHLGEMLKKHAESLHRLEIARTEFSERLEVLEASHHRMLKRYAGRAGGRPVSVPGDSQSLDDIPKGDKDALRRYFAPEIARRGPGSKQEH